MEELLNCLFFIAKCYLEIKKEWEKILDTDNYVVLNINEENIANYPEYSSHLDNIRKKCILLRFWLAREKQVISKIDPEIIKPLEVVDTNASIDVMVNCRLIQICNRMNNKTGIDKGQQVNMSGSTPREVKQLSNGKTGIEVSELTYSTIALIFDTISEAKKSLESNKDSMDCISFYKYFSNWFDHYYEVLCTYPFFELIMTSDSIYLNLDNPILKSLNNHFERLSDRECEILYSRIEKALNASIDYLSPSNLNSISDPIAKEEYAFYTLARINVYLSVLTGDKAKKHIKNVISHFRNVFVTDPGNEPLKMVEALLKRRTMNNN